MDSDIAVPRSNASPAVPIGRISDDVLHDIFLLVVSQSEYLSKELLQTGTSWLAITHACAHWRELALASPQLWTWIQLSSLWDTLMMEAFFRRAGSNLVSLKYMASGDYLYPNARPLGEFINTHSFRLAELSLLNLSHEEAHTILPILQAPALRLRSLEIDLNPAVSVSVSSVFSGQLPSLRLFRTNGLTSALPASASLKELSLTGNFAHPRDELFQLLSMMTSLEVLHLDTGRLHTRSHQRPADVPPAHLPQLKELTLFSLNNNNSRDILQSFSFPPTVTMHLVFRGFDATRSSQLHDISPSLRQLLSGVDDATLTLPGISPLVDHTVMIESTVPNFTAEWRWDSSRSEVTEADALQFMAFKVLSFPALRRLVARCNSHELHGTHWEYVLGDLSDLITLDIDVCEFTLRSLCAALHPRAIVLRRARGLLCPQLKHLRIARFDGSLNGLLDIVVLLAARGGAGARLTSFEINIYSQARLPSYTRDLLDSIAEESSVCYRDEHTSP